MLKKLLILLTLMIIIVTSAGPALAKKPPDTAPNGNPSHQNHGNGNNASGQNSPSNPASPNASTAATAFNSSDGLGNSTSNQPDRSGYNWTARIFNGTAMQWCMEKIGDETWCLSFLGETANDKLIMKWNAEWDRGNAENWSNPPYAAWENNNWNGKVPGGSGDVWHYKIVWVGPCGADGTVLPNGGYCIWGQFEVLTDHGTLDGVHTWFAHAKPSGYGSYP